MSWAIPASSSAPGENQVDADLYSSIYGTDFENDATAGDVIVAAETAPMTTEEQALYGDDYGTEGEYEDD